MLVLTSPHPLAIARAHAELTQLALSQRAGVCRETVSAIERGELPRLRTARAIARALNTSVDAILPPTAPPVPHNDDSRPGKAAVGKASDDGAHESG